LTLKPCLWFKGNLLGLGLKKQEEETAKMVEAMMTNELQEDTDWLQKVEGYGADVIGCLPHELAFSSSKSESLSKLLG